ncbi:MAG: hypothetical protein KDA75_06410 [Planctomycetaceae bacterium]|nr:hypothetical protein [Planctomycetaceae bacterium]
MFGIKRVVAGLLVGGGAMYFADHYHVVHTTEGHVVVPRAQQIALRSSYADVRGWDATKWAQYPELSEAVLQDGRGGLLVEGTVDSLMQKAQSALGVGDQTSTPAEANNRPPIIFSQPTVPTGPSLPAATQLPPASDDSLLGRLSRQLQGGSGGTTLQERPLTRDVPAPTTNSAPVQPAYATPPAATNDRAGISEDYLPENLLPSIHSAAMQRITSEIGLSQQPAAAIQQELQQRTRSADVLPAGVQDVASSLLSQESWTPAAPNSAVPTGSGSLGASVDGNQIPLDIDAGQLQQRMPNSLREGLLRVLTPPPQPSANAGAIELR